MSISLQFCLHEQPVMFVALATVACFCCFEFLPSAPWNHGLVLMPMLSKWCTLAYACAVLARWRLFIRVVWIWQDFMQQVWVLFAWFADELQSWAEQWLQHDLGLLSPGWNQRQSLWHSIAICNATLPNVRKAGRPRWWALCTPCCHQIEAGSTLVSAPEHWCQDWETG